MWIYMGINRFTANQLRITFRFVLIVHFSVRLIWNFYCLNYCAFCFKTDIHVPAVHQ